MPVHLTDHAQKRMAQRGITLEDIEQALNRRAGAPSPGEPGTLWVRGYASGGRLLKVCVSATDHSNVITVAWPDTRERSAP